MSKRGGKNSSNSKGKSSGKMKTGKGRRKNNARGGGKSSSVAPSMKTKHSTTRVKNLIVASETDVWLKEIVNGALQNTGFNAIAEHFYANSFVRTSPGVLRTAAGSTTYGGLYQYYRIPVVKLIEEFVNTEAFPVDVVVIFSNVDPTTTAANYVAYAENPLGFSFQLSPVGSPGCKRVFKKKIMMSEIVGTGIVETDDSFRATIGADPVDLLWYGHAAFATGTNVFTVNKGVYYRKTLTQFTRFYSRAQQQTFMEERESTYGLRSYTNQSVELQEQEKNEKSNQSVGLQEQEKEEKSNQSVGLKKQEREEKQEMDEIIDEVDMKTQVLSVLQEMINETTTNTEKDVTALLIEQERKTWMQELMERMYREPVRQNFRIKMNMHSYGNANFMEKKN